MIDGADDRVSELPFRHGNGAVNRLHKKLRMIAVVHVTFSNETDVYFDIGFLADGFNEQVVS